MSPDIRQLYDPAELTLSSLTLACHNYENERAKREEENSNSGLLRLSPELRNRIYQDTIPTSTRISVVGRVDRKQISLLQVCRAIRNETVPIYYGNTTFTFDLRTRANFQKAESWLDGLSPEAVASLRKIYVNSDPNCCSAATQKRDSKSMRGQAFIDLDSTRWSFYGFEGCKTCSLQDRVKGVVRKIHGKCIKQRLWKDDMAELFEILRPIKASDFSFEVAKDGTGKVTFQNLPVQYGPLEKAKPVTAREIKQPRTRRRNAELGPSDMMPPSEDKDEELTGPSK